jgi:hypothetical protein
MSQSPFIAAVLLGAACLPPAARADLAAASPFLPAAGSAAAAAGPSGPIELRGMMSTAGGMAYCIYDTAKKKDVWVGLNEGGHDFVVRSADSASESVKVDYQGRTLNLTLHAARVASAGPAALSAAPSGVVANPGLSLTPPTPADEQKRLDAVAQEVRRRRLEREKAIQDAPQGPSR